MGKYVQFALDPLVVPKGVVAIHKDIPHKEVKRLLGAGEWENISPPQSAQFFFDRLRKREGIKTPPPKGDQNVVFRKGDRVIRGWELELQYFGFTMVEFR